MNVQEVRNKYIKKGPLHIVVDFTKKKIITVSNVIDYDETWKVDRYIKDRLLTENQVLYINMKTISLMTGNTELSEVINVEY